MTDPMVMATVLLTEYQRVHGTDERADIDGALRSAGIVAVRSDGIERTNVPAVWTDPTNGMDYGRCPTCATLWPLQSNRSPFHKTHVGTTRAAIRFAVRHVGTEFHYPPSVIGSALKAADRYYVESDIVDGCLHCND